MNFLQIQNKVLSDRFDETQREDAKDWINYRYARIWGSEDWTFKYAISTLNVAQNADTVSASSLSRIIDLRDSTVSPTNTPIIALRPEDFLNWQRTTATIPFGYTVVGSTIYFDSPMSSARTFKVMGQLAFDELVDDGDVPLIPSEFHSVIVHGAISEGLRNEQDPLWQPSEEDYRVGINDMKAAYLTQVRTYEDAYPAWP